MESFFHTLKTERVHHRIYATRDQARRDLFGYIEGFYNPRRLHSSLGYITPSRPYAERLNPVHFCGGRSPWRTFKAVEYATLEWVGWLNNRLLLEPIGNIPPAEAEQRYYAAMDDVPIAA